LAGSIHTILSTLKKIVKFGRPSYLLVFGDSLGDNLLLTTLARGLYERGHKNIWIKCNHTELFENNPHIKLVMPFNTLLSGTVLNALKIKIAYPRYTTYNQVTDRDDIPEKHIVLKMADAVKLKGSIVNKPVLQLNGQEKLKGQLQKNQIVITTATTGARFPIRNKEWNIERYQQVVDHLCGAYNFIQLGSPADAALTNVTDLRGKTSIRETAAILSSSVLMVSHVGFMMHLARAVNCRSVIIYGGRERPDQSGYACFNNIYSAVECSPCWLHNTCHYDKKCMELISADMAINAILNQLELTDTPLVEDLIYND
jgi:hypothetical protein